MNKSVNPLLKTAAFIDGRWTGTPGFAVTNPATGQIIARVPDLGAADTLMAVEAAHRSWPIWRDLLAKERSQILRRWFELIVANTEFLAEILTLEQGKPLAEARSEIAYGASFVEFYAEEAKRVYGETMPTFRNDARVVVLKQSLGVVAAITPWNFPNAMITRKVAPALAAGCTVVLKPAEETPLSALALACLAEQAGFPAGVFNVITTAQPAEVGRVLTASPLVRGIAFTGSTEVGKLLIRQAADTVKKMALELGGNAPFIVFDDANLDDAVLGLIANKFRNAGQTCVCANRIYVQDKIYDQFTTRLVAAIKTIKLGNGFEADVTLGPLINPAAIEKVKSHIADAISKGAKLKFGGAVAARDGYFFEPTVLTEVNSSMRLTEEETFGPVAPLLRFQSEQEVINLANATEYGLAAYLYATDLARIIRVSEALETGMVGINTGLLSTENAPFGGVKQSGLGREGSHHGIEEYLQLKYLLLAGLDRRS